MLKNCLLLLESIDNLWFETFSSVLLLRHAPMLALTIYGLLQ
jgi:hypothetical protein